MDNFISEFTPFIKKEVIKFTKRSFEIENTFEFSVAVLAFKEAIYYHSENQHLSFLNFSSLLIRKRLLDYVKFSNGKKTFSISNFEKKHLHLIEQLHLPEQNKYHKEYTMLYEISIFKKMLKPFKISDENLLKYSPRNDIIKHKCFKVAEEILKNNDLLEDILTKKIYPVSKLQKITQVKKRDIRYHKGFIVSAVLIFSSKLDTLKGYINNFLDEKFEKTGVLIAMKENYGIVVTKEFLFLSIPKKPSMAIGQTLEFKSFYLSIIKGVSHDIVIKVLIIIAILSMSAAFLFSFLAQLFLV
jgi:RNA polymerase sigma factor